MKQKERPCKKCKLKKDYKKMDFAWIFFDRCPDNCPYAKEKENAVKK